MVAVDPSGEKYWTAYGPYGPFWAPWNQTCYVYFVLYASPSWYDYIWPWDYGHISAIDAVALPGITRKECSPDAFRCASAALKAQISLDVAHAKFSVTGDVSLYNLKGFELEEWGWATAGGAGGEGAGGAAASGAGGLHGAGAAGEAVCPKPPPKAGCQ